jgi:site-specific recombinase XerD
MTGSMFGCAQHVVSDMLGHCSIRMTEVYAKIKIDASVEPPELLRRVT